MAENKPTKEKFTLAQANAALIAKNVRDHMERFHADGNLSDAQMAELNPIIRNAVYETIVLFQLGESGHKDAKRLLQMLWWSIPTYWEAPRTSDSFRSHFGDVQP